MRVTFRVPVLVAMILLFASPNSARSETIWISGTEGDDAQLSDALAHFPNARQLPRFYELYDNGTTHVRFEKAKKSPINVASEPVLLFFPSTLTENSLMELFIQARLARVANASTVTLISKRPLAEQVLRDEGGNIVDLSIPAFLAIAGVDMVAESGRDPYRPEREHFLEIPRPPALHNVIMGDVHPRLRDDIGRILQIPIVAESEIENLLPRTQVLLLSPSLPPVNRSFFKNLALLRKLRRAGIRVQYSTPYLPYDRLDKSPEGRLAIDLLESVEPSSVTFVQAHARQSANFFAYAHSEISGNEKIARYFKSKGVDAMASPDNGFVKDATEIVMELGIDPKLFLGILNKARVEGEGVKIIGRSGPSLEGRRVGMADDQTLTGATLGLGDQYLRNVDGAEEVFLAVSHSLGNPTRLWEIAPNAILAAIDTLPLPKELEGKIVRLSIAAEIADVWRPYLRPADRQLTRACIKGMVAAALEGGHL